MQPIFMFCLSKMLRTFKFEVPDSSKSTMLWVLFYIAYILNQPFHLVIKQYSSYSIVWIGLSLYCCVSRLYILYHEISVTLYSLISKLCSFKQYYRLKDCNVGLFGGTLFLSMISYKFSNKFDVTTAIQLTKKCRCRFSLTCHILVWCVMLDSS